MNEAQHDHLSKALGNMAQGSAVAAPVAFATGKLSVPGMQVALAGAVGLFCISYWLARRQHHE